MLVKLQTNQYLIYAELDTPERVTHLASQNRIHLRTCYAILHEIERRGDFQVTWGVADGGYTDRLIRKRLYAGWECPCDLLRWRYTTKPRVLVWWTSRKLSGLK